MSFWLFPASQLIPHRRPWPQFPAAHAQCYSSYICDLAPTSCRIPICANLPVPWWLGLTADIPCTSPICWFTWSCSSTPRTFLCMICTLFPCLMQIGPTAAIFWWWVGSLLCRLPKCGCCFRIPSSYAGDCPSICYCLIFLNPWSHIPTSPHCILVHQNYLHHSSSRSQNMSLMLAWPKISTPRSHTQCLSCPHLDSQTLTHIYRSAWLPPRAHSRMSI